MVAKMTAFYPDLSLPKTIQLDYETFKNLSIQAVLSHFSKSWQKKNSSPKTAVFGAGDRTWTGTVAMTEGF